jgi:hypothetical protein
MGKVLAWLNKGPAGTWARIELDSKEVVFVSLASESVRISSMKKRLAFWWPDQTLFEVPTFEAYRAFTQEPRTADYVPVETAQDRTGEFLGWLSGIVSAMPDTRSLRTALPVLIGGETE